MYPGISMAPQFNLMEVLQKHAILITAQPLEPGTLVRLLQMPMEVQCIPGPGT